MIKTPALEETRLSSSGPSSHSFSDLFLQLRFSLNLVLFCILKHISIHGWSAAENRVSLDAYAQLNLSLVLLLIH